MTDQEKIAALEAENEQLRAALEEAQSQDDIMPQDIALAAMQGLCAGGVPPDAAAVNAWLTAVPAYYQGMAQYVAFAEKVQAMPEYGQTVLPLETPDAS